MTAVPPEEAVEQAIDLLATRLVLEEQAVETHTALIVGGLDESEVKHALALYMVALLAGMVRTTLRLTAALLDRTLEGKQRLRADVEARLSPPLGASRSQAEFNEDVRDPWIAECVGHALLAVRERVETPCVRGAVAALMVPHVKPSMQGLDLFAIYEDGGLPAMALGEAKATMNSGGSRLSEAASFFRTVANGDRDVDIRMHVTVLTESLSEELQQGLSAAFWQERASYLPVIAYGVALDVARRRPALGQIPRTAEDKRVIFCNPANYAAFFDDIAAAMRLAVDVVNPDHV
ncbi:MAG: hypothetical protein ACTHMY_08645 [Solirubrobacteraceae bacterium]